MKLVLLIISLFLISGCQNNKGLDIFGGKEKIYKSPDDVNITLKNQELDVFSEVGLKDVIEISDDEIELISEDYEIDTSSLGEKEYELLYKKDNKKYLYKFNVTIKDKEAPRVFGGTNKSVNLGFNGDICDLISYGDNYDGYLKCEIVGDYDLNKIGTYNLKYILKDTSDNAKELEVTLNVTSKSNTRTTSSNNIPKTQFIDILNKHKNESNEIGIDVSKWQGEIDFQKVKEAGATFVMMRIGVQKTALGELEIDQYYRQNIKNAKEAGLKVGVYLYSIATSKEESIKHAKWVIDTLGQEELDLPIVFDWENWSKWNSYHMSFHDINSIADSFIETVNDAGYKGMLYSSKFYLENIWENKNSHPVWLAHYTSNTNYNGDYIMWQLSNTGRIDGINGDVDIDILYNR